MPSDVHATPVSTLPPVGRKYLVSVIITTKNRSHFVEQAIESVLAVHSDQFDLEVIVVDDGSTDDTMAVVQRYSSTYIRTTGIGMANARNTGLRTAHGDFVTLLDDDDLWLPNNIVPQLELLKAHQEFGAVHAQAQLTHADLSPFGEPFPKGKLTSGWLLEELLAYCPQVGTILTRIEVAREVGDLDPTLPGATDWDWILRVAQRYQIGRIEQPVMLFRQRQVAEEELTWRRFPAVSKIFNRHTFSHGIINALRLRPILWHQRGRWATNFLQFAQMNYTNGEYARAYKSLWYAFRCSPLHMLSNSLRSWPLHHSKQIVSEQTA